MIRKAIVNILSPFIILPLFFFIKDLIVIDQKYYQYELDRTSFLDFLAFFYFFTDQDSICHAIYAARMVYLPYTKDRTDARS